MAEILRKMTIKTCGFEIANVKGALGTEKSVELLKVIGITSKATPGQTDKGEYVSFTGDFRAVNMVTGELFQASSCILPNFIADALSHALGTSQEVEFALMIGAKANATSITGYEYTVKPLVEPKVSDKFGLLLTAAGFDSPSVKKLKAA